MARQLFKEAETPLGPLSGLHYYSNSLFSGLSHIISSCSVFLDEKPKPHFKQQFFKCQLFSSDVEYKK